MAQSIEDIVWLEQAFGDCVGVDRTRSTRHERAWIPHQGRIFCAYLTTYDDAGAMHHRWIGDFKSLEEAKLALTVLLAAEIENGLPTAG